MKKDQKKILTRKNYFSSTITLALWRVRLNLGILLLIGFGIIAAVMLVCVVPLYSRVATTAGLRSTLNADKDSPILTIHANMMELSTHIVNDTRSSIEEQIVNPSISKYLDGPVQFSVQSHDMKIVSPAPLGSNNQMVLHGYDVNQLASHAKLVQGRFPSQQSDKLEIVITPDTAAVLHIKVGSMIVINLVAFAPTSGSTPQSTSQISKNLALHVVGLYTADVKHDAFWHDDEVNPVVDASGSLSPYILTALLSNTSLLATLDTLAAQQKVNALETSSLLPDLYWYYRIGTSHLDISQFKDLMERLNTLQSQISIQSNLVKSDPTSSTQGYDIAGDVISVYGGEGILGQYQNRMNAAQIPVDILMLQIICLVLLFVAMMVEILIEYQQEAIAILGSRGANAWQIFGSFVVQGCGLGVIGLIIGPLLALPVVYVLGQRVLLAQGQGAVNIITQDPVGIALSLMWYALAAFFVVVATMSITAYLAFGYNILSLRRNTARSSTRPLWQRFNLDIVAIIVALTGYGIAMYVTNVQNLDAHTYQLIVTPLTLVSPLFLLPALVLLLLRLLPSVLHLCATLVTRGRGVSAVLALGNMSRAPYQSMRMSLLLALSIAFAIFALIFNSTQVAHIAPVANYQVGADFSGPIGVDAPDAPLTVRMAAFKKIPGVTSVTLGLTTIASAGDSTNSTNINLMAVDANTFAQTAYWPAQNSKQSLSTLMRQLAEQRKDVLSKNALPVIIDDLAAESLGLSVGHSFNLQIAKSDSQNNGTITVIAVAEVHHIPTIEDSTLQIDSGSTSIATGILTDYQSYADLYQATFRTPVPTNYVWLRAKNDPVLLDGVRTALTQKQPVLSTVYDRYALMTDLNNDPLHLDILGVLAIGSIVALLLALVGNLQGFWFNIRKRKTNFVVLRALGTTQVQVAGILLWEQGIIYSVAIVLGICIGILLSVTIIPSLVLTATPASQGLSDSDFYALQHIVPLQIAVPSALFILLIAITIFCISTPIILIRLATRSTINQQLRLNED